MSAHDLCVRRGSSSTSRRGCSTTFTGYGCLSGLSSGSPVSSSVARMVQLRSTWHQSCVLWQTSTPDYVLHQRQRLTFHRLAVSPSETVPSTLLAFACETACHPILFCIVCKSPPGRGRRMLVDCRKLRDCVQSRPG